MIDDVAARVEANPKYHQLVNKRSAYSVFMTLCIIVVYFGYILLIAFADDLLAIKMGAGMTTSIGIPMGLGVIVITIILTNIYVRRANTEFDQLNSEIIAEAGRK